MGKTTSRKNNKTVRERRTRKLRETPHFPLYIQLGGNTPALRQKQLELLSNLPNGNGTTNFAAWYDASDPNGNGILPANGSTLNGWIDKSRNNRNLSVNEGTIYFRSNFLNGPAIDFKTTANAYLSSSQFSLNDTVSIYMVLVIGDTPTDTTAPFFAHCAFNDSNRGIVLSRGKDNIPIKNNSIGFSSKAGNVSLHLNKSNTLTAVPGNGDMYQGTGALFEALNVISLYSCRINKSLIKANHFKAGESNATGGYPNITKTELCANNDKCIKESARANGIIYPSAMYLGNGGAGSNIRSHMKEIIYFQEFHTDEQAQLIEGYLAWKWGIQTESGGPLPRINPYSAFDPLETIEVSAARASRAIASGQMASAAYASGQQYSGAYASGQIASAAHASGQIASAAYASGQMASAANASAQQYSGAYASGQQYSGAYASGQQASAAYASGQMASAANASAQQYSGAYASGQQYSGAYASGQQYSGAYASGQQYSGA